jgi:transcriptional regulator GlxA family with amidase domain
MDEETPLQNRRPSGPNQEQGPVSAVPNPYELRLSGRHEGLLRLHEWVAENGGLRLTLEEAAKIACLEPHHFSKIFHKFVGESFKGWRRRVRISWAVLLIERGTYSVDEVIRLSGYRDRRAFERAVKALTGVTPGRIRSGVDGAKVFSALREQKHN